MCCRCNNRRRTTNSDCHDSDIRSFPRRREEMEQTLMSTPAEGEEHSEEWLKIFSQEAETGDDCSTGACNRRGSRQHGFC
jgi:hypothetical protein